MSVGLDDYSFVMNQDLRTYTIDKDSLQPVGPYPSGGYMDATKTWVYFYAKDYGGWARVVAKIWIIGQQNPRSIELQVPKDEDDDGFADKWEIAMAERWRLQYNKPPFTTANALLKFNPVTNPNQDDEERDPDGAGEGRPFVDQAETGDAHTVVEEYRGYILDGGGLDGAGLNGHAGGHIRLDPARKEILVEVDRGAVVNNVPGSGTVDQKLAGILNGASKVFSNTDRGAGIYLYYLFDEVTLDLPKDKVDTEDKRADAWAASRDSVAARTTGTADLKTDFLHFLFVDENGKTGGTGAVSNDTEGDLNKRGSMIAVSDMSSAVVPNGLDSSKFDEFLMTVAAHEITHLLFEKVSGPFNGGEHTVNANGNGTDRDAEDQTCLMYDGTSRPQCELATVRFFPVVQQELKVKSNQALVL